MNQLVAAGALAKAADGTYGGANGYTYGRSISTIYIISPAYVRVYSLG